MSLSNSQRARLLERKEKIDTFLTQYKPEERWWDFGFLKQVNDLAGFKDLFSNGSPFPTINKTIYMALLEWEFTEELSENQEELDEQLIEWSHTDASVDLFVLIDAIETFNGGNGMSLLKPNNPISSRFPGSPDELALLIDEYYGKNNYITSAVNLAFNENVTVFYFKTGTMLKVGGIEIDLNNIQLNIGVVDSIAGKPVESLGEAFDLAGIGDDKWGELKPSALLTESFRSVLLQDVSGAHWLETMILVIL